MFLADGDRPVQESLAVAADVVEERLDFHAIAAVMTDYVQTFLDYLGESKGRAVYELDFVTKTIFIQGRLFRDCFDACSPGLGVKGVDRSLGHRFRRQWPLGCE